MIMAIVLCICWLMVAVRFCGSQIVSDPTRLRFEPSNVIVQEGSNVSITCNISNTEDGVYNIRSGYNASYIYHPQENCRVYGPLTDTQTYSVRCIGEDVQITILNVSRDRHGEVWTCRRNMFEKIYESNCTITVNVPITTLTSVNWTRYAATKENLDTIFVCTTSPGFPEALIDWYKNNVLLTKSDASSLMTSSSTSSDTYLVTVTSTLKIILQRGDNASTIHCVASNNNTISIQSSKTSMLVYYAPDVPVLTIGNIQLNGDLTVREGSTTNMTCTAKSFPDSKYVWTTPRNNTHNIISGHSLTVNNISRHEGGSYTCRATNMMKLSSGKTYQGESEASVFINVLYSPVSDTVDERDILLPAVSGGSAAFVILIISLVVVLIVRYRRRRKQRNTNKQQCLATYEASTGVCDLQVYENVIIYEDVVKTAKQPGIELPMYENVNKVQPNPSTTTTGSKSTKQPASKAKRVGQQRPLRENYENLILQCERKYN